MLHFFNCKKLKYIHDEPYTLTDSKNQKIKLKKGDVLILDDGAMYRSLKYKTRLFAEVPLGTKEKAKQEAKEKAKQEAKEEAKQEKGLFPQEDNPSATEEVSNKE